MNVETLTAEEIRIMHKMLDRIEGGTVIDSWNRAQIDRIRSHDPFAAALLDHQPVELAGGWACSCAGRKDYVSKTHHLITHVKPIAEKAATHKIRQILERAGMDLDVIIQSDKIFGGNQ